MTNEEKAKKELEKLEKMVRKGRVIRRYAGGREAFEIRPTKLEELWRKPAFKKLRTFLATFLLIVVLSVSLVAYRIYVYYQSCGVAPRLKDILVMLLGDVVCGPPQP